MKGMNNRQNKGHMLKQKSFVSAAYKVNPLFDSMSKRTRPGQSKGGNQKNPYAHA
jgi:hypothetical protein